MDEFIYWIDTKSSLPIDRFVSTVVHLNVRVSKKKIVEGMMHYLFDLPNTSAQHTLCIMPKGHGKKPQDLETIKYKQFYIINVEASSLMQNIEL